MKEASMPNWCEDELTIRGKSGVLACLDAIKGESDTDGPRYIDFEKIVPMPAILLGRSEPADEKGRVLLGDDALGHQMLSHEWVKAKGITNLEGLRAYFREHFPNAEEDGRLALQAKQETGCWDWWEWRTGGLFNEGHWGTKWNACYFTPLVNATDTRADIDFCTAWSPPRPVVVELSKLFPTLAFTLKYWEGGGGFRGLLRTKAGEVRATATYMYRGPRGG
jgi:hypothetical protein